MSTITTSRVQWDEPAGCTTPRGWLKVDGMCVGFYLDYGNGHYRSPHSQVLGTINGMREVVFCQPGRLCPTCQPGNILACRYPAGPCTTNESRYFETIAEAREWVETGITR